jgi:hypothetical protein
MNDQWTNKLSDYLDNELDAGHRAALEAHLVTCANCRVTLDELRAVVARAKALEDRAPAKDLWFGIRSQIAQAPATPKRRFSFSVPQLLAASIALVLLSGGGVWMALQRREPLGRPGTTIAVTSASWTRHTDVAIVELQDALTRNESRLDTATVRIVRQNLAVIDRAIADARAALESDPGNTYLNLHLAATMRRKVELLRRVNALAAART